MKEISDYFTSPTKKQDDAAELKGKHKLQKNESLSSDNPDTSSAIENKNEANNTPPKSRKKRKKSNKSKIPDPAVNNISELFLNSLNLKSPNKTERLLNSTAESELVISNGTPNTKGNTIQTPNAFQLLMDRRHKVIGSNSPGNEPDNNIEKDDPVRKETLNIRKKLLTEWSEKKGKHKRKRIEEELDEVISYKLEKRAKRLKKLLQHDNNDKKDNRKRKKRLKRLSSSSDSIVSIVSHESEDGKNDTTSSDSVRNNDLPKVEFSETLKQKNEKFESPKHLPTNGNHIFNKGCKDSNNRKSSLLDYFGSATRIDSYSDEKSVGLVEKKSTKNTRGRPRKSLISTEVAGEDAVEKIDNPQKRRAQNIKNTGKSINPKITQDKENASRNSLNCKSLNESNENILPTPRKLKSWKLKIKISMDQHKNQNSDESSDQDSGSDSDPDVIVIDNGKKYDNSKIHKIAPMFFKATPKPKEDPEVLEARKRFLMSEMPSNMKRSFKKQQSLEDKEFTFPKISHVQQICDSVFWNMTRPNINTKEMSPMNLHELSLTCNHITKSRESLFTLDFQHKQGKIIDVTNILGTIKIENPDYPVFKSYRYISEKCQMKKNSKPKNKKSPKTKGRKGKRKSLNNSIEIIEPEKVEFDLSEYAMWTEKYKPKSSEEIIGNTESVRNLRTWLETWKNFSKEMNMHKKRKADDSDSEFDTTDIDDDSSRDSFKFSSSGNTMVLSGPCGTGKSSTVYAICNELAFNVIEINASSKRTGKRLIQKLQEATQSHQVRKHNNMQMQSLSHKCNEETSSDNNRRKMCVLFVEDIDIIFEQDDGFLSALTQLITTSKRPIIISTTDYNSVFVQKSLGQYKHIQFHPLSSYSLATWLQILCLVEGIFVNRNDIGSLLEYNKGDVRKTLLQLQFWVQSGGEITSNNMSISLIEHEIRKHEEQFTIDDEPDNKKVFITKDEETANKIFEHKNCIRSFEIFEKRELTYVPYYIDLGLLWWNISNILDIPPLTTYRNTEMKNNLADSTKNTSTKCERYKYSDEDKKRLKSLTDIYSSVCLADCYFRKLNYFDSSEPNTRSIQSIGRDSVALNEKMECYNVDMELVHDVTHNLIDGYVREYGNKNPRLDLTLPNKTEKRWRAKQLNCISKFQEILPTSASLDKKSIALDYLPCLRNISRSENRREINNTKRGNRFRNYLNLLGLRGSEYWHLANDILI